MQGSQNDIKKLRRENEQLRREIWSLRDEYDKLEEILKRQKNREDSEEYEDRSDEDDGLQSDYSYEEDEEDTQDSPKEPNKSEQLENAENQKISTEKMTSNSQHRLHVDFDDLSVVDEEEEPKRDKEKKEAPSEETQALLKEDKGPLSILKSRQLHENIPFYPGTYQPPTGINSPSYYAECPFKFPSTLNLMLPIDASTMLNTDPLMPMTNLGSLARPNVDQMNSLTSIGSLTEMNVDQMTDQILHAPPVGWQSNIVMPQKQITTFGAPVNAVNGSSNMQGFGIHHGQLNQQSFDSTIGGFPTLPSYVPRRSKANAILKPGPVNPFNPTVFANSLQNNEKAVTENGDILNLEAMKSKGPPGLKKAESEESAILSASEKPKHFFSPLPSKLRKRNDESSPTISQFGTGNSSSSDRTGSTIVSKNHFAAQKGSADVYVNGAIPFEDNLYRNKTEQRTFLSSDNLLVNEVKNGTGNQLTKSMSCQDLSSESQVACIGHTEGRQPMMTQSDNTLDNILDSKPYKSHLSVTLKTPRVKQAISPDTPEIPNLPTIDYGLFKNPFLRSFDQSYMEQNNVTRPLSVQVNDDNLCYYSPQPEVSTTLRGAPLGADRYRVQADQNRLLIPSNQLINGKSPAKHQIQVTSFERPSPHTLIGPTSPYELNSTLRRLNTNPYLPSQTLYQNMPFLSRAGLYSQRGMMYYDNLALKVPAQTQTSLDGDSHHEDEPALSHEDSAANIPSGQRRKRTIRKEKINILKEQKPLSPVAQRRLKKQASVTSSEVPESPGKVARRRPRRLSITTTTTSEGQEDKNDSRSSSSGQDSPKKDQIRRVSLYFNTKKRPSLSSVKTARSGSLDITAEKDAMVMNCERERTNSLSSRETGSAKARKASTSSGNVPWCACWGNGCV